MTTSTSTQILIVGAGPTGLALACHCLQLGLRVRVIDKQPGPSTTSKAVGLQYRVSEVLACMGVADRFLRRGSTPTAVNIYSGGRRLVQLDFSSNLSASGRDAFAPRPIMLPQSETEALLGDLLRERGGHVEWNTSFVEFRQDEEKVVSRLLRPDGSEEQVESAFLVSCEGAHSVIRKQAGLSFAGKTYPLAFFMADVEVDGSLEHGQTHVWLQRDGALAAIPFPRPGAWRLMVEVTQQLDSLHGQLTLDVIRELFARRVGLKAAISNPTWISEFRIHSRMVEHYRLGRVFLAGDAAHIHSPTGGQGIVTGIQDATNLAWKLARVLGGAPERLLDTYEEERLPKAREVLHETERSTNLLTAPTRLARLLRDYVVLPVLRLGWVQRRMFSRMAQLHVNYRGCRLSRQEDTHRWFGRARVQAGDRAPDVAFAESGSGQKRTLFELLRPMRPVALIGPGPSAGDVARAERLAEVLGQLGVDASLVTAPGEERCKGVPHLTDVYGDWRRLYGLSGEFLCLVRPDDHVGLLQRPIDKEALRSYLEELCPPEKVARAFRDRPALDERGALVPALA